MAGLKTKNNVVNSKLQDESFLKDIVHHDIICLSETHCSYEDDMQIEGFSCFKLCRAVTKKINRYFGGIAVYYRKELKQGIKFLEHKNDDYVWIKLCKYFFNLDEDYYLCYAYIPPEYSSYYKVRKQDTLEYIENDIVKFSKKGYVLLSGDLNARTGDIPDTIVNDNEIGCDKSPFYSVDNDINIRYSQDKNNSCSRGKRLVDICVASKLRIANGSRRCFRTFYLP